MAMWRYNDAKGKKQGPMPKDVSPSKAGGIGALYCTLVRSTRSTSVSR